jgi:hypothetical protein
MPPTFLELVGVQVEPGSSRCSIVACASTVLFGSVSAIRGIRGTGTALDLTPTTRATARLGGARLVTAEIAIGLVLSVLAALMVRSLINLRSIDLGFRAEAVVAGRVSLPSIRYPRVANYNPFFDALLTRVRAIPGVTFASIGTTRPFDCCAPATSVRDPLRAESGVTDAPTTDIRFRRFVLLGVANRFLPAAALSPRSLPMGRRVP